MIANIDEFEADLRAQKGKKCVFIGRKCPGDACPAWWKTQWNLIKGDGPQTKFIEGCSLRLQHLYFQELMRETAHLSHSVGTSTVTVRDTVDEFRDRMSDGLVRLSGAVARLPQNTEPPKELPDADTKLG